MFLVLDIHYLFASSPVYAKNSGYITRLFLESKYFGCSLMYVMQNEIECLEMNSLIEYFSYLNYIHQNNKVSHEMMYNIGITY